MINNHVQQEMGSNHLSEGGQCLRLLGTILSPKICCGILKASKVPRISTFDTNYNLKDKVCMLMKDVIKNKEKNRENAHGVVLTSMVYQCSGEGQRCFK